MKLISVLLLVLLSVHVHAQLNCTDIACDAVALECEGSCVTLSGCCEACCDNECVDCFTSPCDNWGCVGHPEYTCRDDYCGGCNRIWYDGNGARTACESEIFVSHFFFSLKISFCSNNYSFKRHKILVQQCYVLLWTNRLAKAVVSFVRDVVMFVVQKHVLNVLLILVMDILAKVILDTLANRIIVVVVIENGSRPLESLQSVPLKYM